MSTKENCYTPEIGTKVFAYFNLVLSCLACLASIGLLVYSFLAGELILPRAFTDLYYDPDGLKTFLYQIGILILGILFTTIAVVFAGFLLSGVLKKKPSYLQTYFVYGVIVLILSLLSVLSALCLGWGRHLLAFVISAVFICAIYAVILWMIRKTILLYRWRLANQHEHEMLNARA